MAEGVTMRFGADIFERVQAGPVRQVRAQLLAPAPAGALSCECRQRRRAGCWTLRCAVSAAAAAAAVWQAALRDDGVEVEYALTQEVGLLLQLCVRCAVCCWLC